MREKRQSIWLLWLVNWIKCYFWTKIDTIKDYWFIENIGVIPVAKYLIERGANIQAVDYNGSTPLHEITQRQNLGNYE